MDEIKLALAQFTFISLKEKIILHKNLDSLDKLALMSIEDISQIIGRTVNPQFWNGKKAIRDACISSKIMSKMGINGVWYEETEYPAMLREIFDPPFAFFYRGNLSVLEKRCISMVGTRRICRETALAAFNFAEDATLDGKTVVSGLAFGIDEYAHKGAISSCHKANLTGTTAAILPCGIDTITPSSHKVLANEILRTGGLIASEYLPGTPAEPWRYVQRNRIIAALSPSTVVIHAPPASGALLTANFALDYNRDVIFHSAGFCENAQRIAESIRKRLASSNKEVDAKKLKRTAEKFVSDGAAIVKNYDEYIEACGDAPGTHISNKNRQMSLF